MDTKREKDDPVMMDDDDNDDSMSVASSSQQRVKKVHKVNRYERAEKEAQALRRALIDDENAQQASGNDIEKIKDHYEKEIGDRRDAAEGNAFSGQQVVPLEDPNLDVKLSPYEFVMLHIAHKSNRPVSNRPAFRILKFCESREDAFDHLRECPHLGAECALHLFPLSKWVALCRSLEDQQNAEYCFNYVDETIERNRAEIEEKNKEFEENVREKKAGEVDKDKMKLKAHLKSRIKTAAAGRQRAIRTLEKKKMLERGGKKASKLKRDDEVRGQRYAVVSVCRDNTVEGKKAQKTRGFKAYSPQPLVRFHAVFDDKDEATKWTEEVASSKVINHDLYVVDMYEWLYPEEEHLEQVEGKYRNEEQQKIFAGKDRAEKTLVAFDEWAKAEQREIPETIVESDGTVRQTAAARKVANEVKIQDGEWDKEELKKGNLKAIEVGEEKIVEGAQAVPDEMLGNTVDRERKPEDEKNKISLTIPASRIGKSGKTKLSRRVKKKLKEEEGEEKTE